MPSGHTRRPVIATMRRVLALAVVCVVPVVALAPSRASAGTTASGDWRVRLKEELPLLGHRNWIAVVDSAYPLQTSGGIETVETDADQLEVVQAVLDQLANAKHVRPVIFTDAELKVVPESDAKGVTAYRGGNHSESFWGKARRNRWRTRKSFPSWMRRARRFIFWC